MPPWCIDFLFGFLGSMAAALGRVVTRVQAGGTRPAYFGDWRYWILRVGFALVAGGGLAVAAAPVCEERRLIVAFAAGAAALIAVDRMTRSLPDDAR